ncbi:MAG TPA: hypothetical protein VMU39_21820 [Solirubrobacteraceae bacterium]|nr:hypothetical protein [Solirubrobacteraceae bacterium]
MSMVFGQARLRGRGLPAPSTAAVLTAIYASGWVGGFAVTSVVYVTNAVTDGSLAGPSDISVWSVLASALAAGLALPHVLAWLSPSSISARGAMIAMLAGGLFDIVAGALVPVERLAFPGALGLVLSVTTIPWLFVCYLTLRLVELRPAARDRTTVGPTGLLSVTVPVLACLAVVVLCVVSLRATSGRLGGSDVFHLSSGSSMSTADELNVAGTQMARMLNEPHGDGRAHVTLTGVTCTKTSARPAFLDGQLGGRLDCTADYANGYQGHWCAAFDTHHGGQLLTYYEGRRMCEGPADAKLTFP